jgi:hypothetical protein
MQCVPSIELASETGKLGLFVEELWHDLIGKALFLENDKTTAMGKPCDDIGELFVGQNLHHLHRMQATSEASHENSSKRQQMYLMATDLPSEERSLAHLHHRTCQSHRHLLPHSKPHKTDPWCYQTQ